jgi:hypothetical protein
MEHSSISLTESCHKPALIVRTVVYLRPTKLWQSLRIEVERGRAPLKNAVTS